MTTEKFQRMCEQVLVPMLGDLFYRHLTTVHEDVEIVARELVSLNSRVDRLLEAMSRQADA